MAIAGAAACGDSGDGGPSLDPGPHQGACAKDGRVGGFEIALREGFTSVQGQVFDAVQPSLVPNENDSSGSCRLLAPPQLFCDPACGTGETCAPGNTCVAQPVARSVGEVTVHGLAAEVSMTANGATGFYTFTGELPHPGFAEGDAIVLAASGDDSVDEFVLGGTGIAPLAGAADSVTLEEDQPVVVTWAASVTGGAGTIHLDLNIAQHGGTPGWIECDEIDDDGEFEIPLALTNALLANGYSGFPSVEVTRRTADSTTTDLGCVELTVKSSVIVDIDIPGLTSCSGDGDCEAPETCQDDLTCG